MKVPRRSDGRDTNRPGWPPMAAYTIDVALLAAWAIERLLRAIGVPWARHTCGTWRDRFCLAWCCPDWITTRLRLRRHCHDGRKCCNANKPDHLQPPSLVLGQRGRCDGVPKAVSTVRGDEPFHCRAELGRSKGPCGRCSSKTAFLVELWRTQQERATGDMKGFGFLVMRAERSIAL